MLQLSQPFYPAAALAAAQAHVQGNDSVDLSPLWNSLPGLAVILFVSITYLLVWPLMTMNGHLMANQQCAPGTV